MSIQPKGFRSFPPNSTEVTREGVDAVVYIRDHAEPARFTAIGYSGKRTKASFNFWFRTAAQRDQHVASFFDRIADVAKYKAEQKAAQRAKVEAGHGMNVGDVLATSWGYDQTNVDFYEVVEVSPKSIVVQGIGKDCTDSGNMSGHVVPNKAARDAKKFRSIFTGNGFKVEGHHASKYDGTPKYCSWYA